MWLSLAQALFRIVEEAASTVSVTQKPKPKPKPRRAPSGRRKSEEAGWLDITDVSGFCIALICNCSLATIPVSFYSFIPEIFLLSTLSRAECLASGCVLPPQKRERRPHFS
ncbi:hypothetical protein DSO57_1025006 [Entomophthora muscae]|uniref:Uncharacterized protein n=1 Tax=Entomophthora muscae TaxID=34485 RepID=A0ACC2SRQ9_9FUNG|nr:hypothetical protein DSO57_1025006 [Entomophthora muscae]